MEGSLIIIGVERMEEFNCVLPALLVRDRKPAQQRRLLRGKNWRTQREGRFQLVVPLPLNRFRRCDAGDCAVDRCAERVDIRPGTLFSAREILFLRRVTGLEHHR